MSVYENSIIEPGSSYAVLREVRTRRYIHVSTTESASQP